MNEINNIESFDDSSNRSRKKMILGIGKIIRNENSKSNKIE